MIGRRTLHLPHLPETLNQRNENRTGNTPLKTLQATLHDKRIIRGSTVLNHTQNTVHVSNTINIMLS